MGPSFDTIVASGPRGALPHGKASDKLLKRGELVVMDFGCKVGEYCSDFTRTVCVGRASALQRKAEVRNRELELTNQNIDQELAEIQ